MLYHSTTYWSYQETSKLKILSGTCLVEVSWSWWVAVAIHRFGKVSCLVSAVLLMIDLCYHY